LVHDPGHVHDAAHGQRIGDAIADVAIAALIGQIESIRE
jgi:hypothetical protein